MLIAESNIKEKCNISKLTIEEIRVARKKKWFCPGCQTQVIIKSGKINRAHFAHKTRETCSLFSESESEEHLKGKKIIANNCEKYGIEYELEAFLPELNQRPDVLIEKKIAIEFQCSSLSSERFKERTESYLDYGYQVVWLLGKKFHLKEKLSSLQKQFIYFSHDIGFYLWEMDVEKELIVLDYFILIISSKMYIERKIFNLNHNELVEIVKSPNHIVELKRMTTPAINYYEQQCLWNRQLNQKQKKVMELQSFFYTKGQNLRAINKICFLPSFLTPLLMEEELILRYLVYEYFLTYQKGSIKEIVTYVMNEYQFSTFTLVANNMLLGYCISLYLTFLKEQEIIQIDEKSIYSLKNTKGIKEVKYEILWLPLKYVMISK